MKQFVLVVLLSLGLLASDCEHCEGKFTDAFYTINTVDALYLGNQKSLTIANPGVDAVYNRFLGIYLIKGRSHSQSVDTIYPFKETKAGLFASGKINTDVNFTKQCGLREFVNVAKKIEPFSILSGICCHLLAVANQNGYLIDAKFIEDFVQKENIHYGDIGVRFNEKMEVIYINPYYATSLQVGDRVNNFGSICQLEDRIVFAKSQENISLRVNRTNQNLTYNVQVYQRFGGGLVSDTFLEQFGLRFSDNLTIIAIEDGSIAHQRGLKVGDRLLRIENHPVANANDVKGFFTYNPQSKYSYLIDRDNFQFFIEI